MNDIVVLAIQAKLRELGHEAAAKDDEFAGYMKQLLETLVYVHQTWAIPDLECEPAYWIRSETVSIV